MTLPGPWPRRLTFAEIEQLKARAMLTIEHKLVQIMEAGDMNVGDQYMVSYTLHCGTPEEMKADEATKCGAVPPLGGPSCLQKKGHEGQHSSVTRW